MQLAQAVGKKYSQGYRPYQEKFLGNYMCIGSPIKCPKIVADDQWQLIWQLWYCYWQLVILEQFVYCLKIEFCMLLRIQVGGSVKEPLPIYINPLLRVSIRRGRGHKQVAQIDLAAFSRYLLSGPLNRLNAILPH